MTLVLFSCVRTGTVGRHLLRGSWPRVFSAEWDTAYRGRADALLAVTPLMAVIGEALA